MKHSAIWRKANAFDCSLAYFYLYQLSSLRLHRRELGSARLHRHHERPELVVHRRVRRLGHRQLHRWRQRQPGRVLPQLSCLHHLCLLHLWNQKNTKWFECRVDKSIELLCHVLSPRHCIQCDQIGRFIGLWATFQSPWPTIILPKYPTFLDNFCKGVKIYHFLKKSILGHFSRHLAIFSGHTDCIAWHGHSHDGRLKNYTFNPHYLSNLVLF